MSDARWASTNRANWDDRANAHLKGDGDYYDLAGLKAGRSSLRSVEIEMAGDVAGRRLLHLMCHIGLDSISWARLGARVTAVDFSSVSIAAGRRLASELDVDVAFYEADVYALPEECNGPFDAIIMTYGVLSWLSDIGALALDVAARLAPGGRFILVDGHPLTNLWPPTCVGDDLVPKRDSYFAKALPERRESPRSYGSPSELANATSYQWQHPLSGVVQAVINAGMRISQIREEPFGFYRRYPAMTRRPDGYLNPPPAMEGIPLLFALMAERT